MASGFILARIGADTILVARSNDCSHLVDDSNNSSQRLATLLQSVDDLSNGELRVEHIICDISNTNRNQEGGGGSGGGGCPVVCLRSYPVPTSSSAGNSNDNSIPTVVLTCLVTNVSADIARKETKALNYFAAACIEATSKPACESLWQSLFSKNSGSSSGSNLFSCATRTACGLPRCIVDRAMPLSFCFVPPAALGGSGGESLPFLNRHPPLVQQDRTAEISAAMRWNRDENLTEYITDTLRICSSFVADSTISDVNDLLESRYACELLPPHPSSANPSDPKYHQTLAAAFINANEAAQSSFFGRGTWFTGLFAADGAVVAATSGFFRLKMDDQIIVSTLVAQCNSGAGGGGDESSAVYNSVVETRYHQDVGQQQQQQGHPATAVNSSNNNRPSVIATALPPQLNAVETQVQFRVDLSSTTDAVPGAVTVFILDEHLRFVVGMPKHQQHGTTTSLMQRTTSEISMWVGQLLGNSMQVVSAREVAKYCSAQQPTEGGFFGFCMSCCGGGGGGVSDSSVPTAGLRRISYLTPGLLRHYSVVLAATVARAKQSGRYFAVPGDAGAAGVRLFEAAAFAEVSVATSTTGANQQGRALQQRSANLFNNNATTVSNTKTTSSAPPPVLRYFVQFTRSNSPGNNASSKYMLPGDESADGDDANGGAATTAAMSSLLNAHSWRDLLSFSDLVLLDSVTPVSGLTVGVAAARSPSFSVASFATGGSAVTAEQYQNQTTKAVEAARAVSNSLQHIVAAAVQAATTPSMLVLAQRVQAQHGTAVQ